MGTHRSAFSMLDGIVQISKGTCEDILRAATDAMTNPREAALCAALLQNGVVDAVVGLLRERRAHRPSSGTLEAACTAVAALARASPEVRAQLVEAGALEAMLSASVACRRG